MWHQISPTSGIFNVKVKGGVIAFNGSPFQSYEASPAVWD